jgi:hypothetical protein
MTGLLRDSAKRILNGMLFGVGFGLVVGGMYYFISEKMMRSVWNDAAFEKVVITSQEETKRADGTFILGIIENRGTESIRSPTVQADLLDKTGKFVDQCWGYLMGSLQAGEARHFKVTCGTKDKPVAEHDSYKLRVVGM